MYCDFLIPLLYLSIVHFSLGNIKYGSSRDNNSLWSVTQKTCSYLSIEHLTKSDFQFLRKRVLQTFPRPLPANSKTFICNFFTMLLASERSNA